MTSPMCGPPTMTPRTTSQTIGTANTLFDFDFRVWDEKHCHIVIDITNNDIELPDLNSVPLEVYRLIQDSHGKSYSLDTVSPR
jgi:hypothetical protein